MIRNFHKQDLDRTMKLWLDANISVHDFIKSEYWISNYNAVKAMIPDATVYVYEEDDVMQGFIGLMNQSIAGIFVAQQFRSKGIGKKLLDYVKNKNDVLLLNVYKENDRAVHFYLRERFIISDEQIDENTGAVELIMEWRKNNNACLI